MTVLIIVAHPNRASFNHAIAAACCETLRANGHNVTYHDLYEERFDPVLPFSEFSREATLSEEIALHCNELSQADGIVIVHSNWWGQPPAILKGWIDRVVRPGVAYEFKEGDKGEGVPHGLLRPKQRLCSILPTLRRRGRRAYLAIRLKHYGRTVSSIYAA